MSKADQLESLSDVEIMDLIRSLETTLPLMVGWLYSSIVLSEIEQCYRELQRRMV